MQFDRSLGFVIGETSAKMKNNLAKALKPYNVTPEQWVLLVHLWDDDGITQKELAEKSNKDQPTTTRILDKLEKRGLLYRTADPNDRRAFLIYLTNEGKDAKEPLTGLARKALAIALHGLSNEEQELLRGLLKRIINNLS